MRKIFVLDSTLRDGEQSPGCGMDGETKFQGAERLAKLGVDVIEAGFPVSSPGEFAAVSRIAAGIKGPVICALARTRNEDIEAAGKAVAFARRKRIHVFVATSDVHMESKLRKTSPQILAMIEESVKLAKTYTDDVQFSPEDATRTGLKFLLEAVSVAIGAGATTINIPDTVGYAVPGEFGIVVKAVVDLAHEKNDKVVVSVHCHNDLGLAVANTLAGVEAGAGQVECVVSGLGERAGNAQLEAVVMALKTRADYYGIETGIVTQQLCPVARFFATVIGKPLSDTLPISGGNAFRHGAGIHLHGVKMEKSTYEIMSATDVGWEGDLSPLTNRSGRTALKDRLLALGYTIGDELLSRVYAKVTLLADQKRFVYSEDLHLLMQECFVEDMAIKEKLLRVVRVDYHRVDGAKSATVTLSNNGSLVEASGSGNGPVECIGDAILKVLGRMEYPSSSSISFSGYTVSQTKGGTKSIGSVSIRAEVADTLGYGRGSDTDTLFATAKAMVSAINHLMQAPVHDENSNA